MDGTFTPIQKHKAISVWHAYLTDRFFLMHALVADEDIEKTRVIGSDYAVALRVLCPSRMGLKEDQIPPSTKAMQQIEALFLALGVSRYFIDEFLYPENPYELIELQKKFREAGFNV